MRNIDILKQLLKDSSKQIRETRIKHKLAQKSGSNWGCIFDLNKLTYEHRHHHIAYCELRGKTRAQIEPKVRKHNNPRESYINQLKLKYAWSIEEIAAYEERKNAKAIHSN